MSESDSFLDEVSEEVRKDQLLATLKKYRFLIAGVIILLVGGTAFAEWRKSSQRSAAEARGDALIAAMEMEDPAAMAAALNDLKTGPGAAVVLLRQAAAYAAAGNAVSAGEALDQVIAGDVPEIYKEMARLQLVGLPGGSLSRSDKLTVLQGMDSEGHPLQALAKEQRALINLDAGETEAALDDLKVLFLGEQFAEGVRSRAAQLIIALGEELPQPPETSEG